MTAPVIHNTCRSAIYRPHVLLFLRHTEMDDNISFYERPKQSDPVAIVSIPLELGSDERGLAAAPRYLFQNGIEKVVESLDREISEAVTIFSPAPRLVASAGRMKNAHEIVSVAKRTSAAVEKAARRGDTVLALGGDHSISFGSIAGAAAAHSSMGVIYIDAHPDCNTDETTISGNVHGMVAAAMMGAGHPILTDIAKRKISPEHFLFIGLKDIDEAEVVFLRERSVKCITMLDIARCGLAPAIAAIDELAKKVDTLWISMDMDSIDEAYAPGVGLPTHGGLTRREALGLAHYIGKSCRVAGLDIVEIVPAKDQENKTATLALELTARFLGGEYSWYKGYMDTYSKTNVTESIERTLG